MMDFVNIAYQYNRGKESGHLPTLLIIIGFFLLFKPIVFIMKITGIFALLQWVGLINEHGYFDFVTAALFLLYFVLFMIVAKIVFWIFFGISNFLISISNSNKKKFTNIHQ